MAIHDTVTQALKAVRANQHGRVEFSTLFEADEFSDEVFADYPCEGYGTSVTISPTTVGTPVTVTWRIYSAD